MATPSSSKIADARVVLRSPKYFRLAKKVSWPGSACSMPATPVISTSGPSRWHPSFWASSESFMERAPQFALGVFERHSRNATDHGKYRRFGLFVEKARLRGRHHCGGWVAPGDAHDANHGNLRERRARHKNTVGRGIHVGRHNLQAVIEQRQKIIRDDPSRISPSLNRSLTQRPSRLGRLNNA